MCGIAGALDPDVERARRRVQTLNRLQEHRGPDNSALATCGPFVLGNTRLAIQDLSPKANQPLTNSDGRFICVFNGEIYNHVELRRSYGLQVETDTDGAVIPALWERLGTRCLKELRGMWAIALVDTKECTLTLARDPFGIKPLFLRFLPDGAVLFASELTALGSIAPKPTIRPGSIMEFLHRGALGRTSTPFEQTSLLAPNSWIQFDRPSQQSPSPRAKGNVLDGRRALTAHCEGPPLRAVLDEAVALHLRSDVPTALLLSAGLDSALLAASAARLGRRLHCFTVQVEGTEDETGGAAGTAAHYRHEHHAVRAHLGPSDVDDFFAAMQRPTIDGLNTFVISKAIHKSGYRVALSGLGGDEACAGYPHMRHFPLVQLLSVTDRLPGVRKASQLVKRPKLAELLRPGGPRDAARYDELFRRVISLPTADKLTGHPAGQSFVSENEPSDTSLRSLIELEVEHYLQGTLLPDADCFSMRWSLELRVPVLDVPLFRQVAAAAHPLMGKRALTQRLRDPYLSSLARQRKRGFSVPMRAWLTEGPLRELANEAAAPWAPVWDYVDRAAWKALVAGEPPTRWATRWALASLNGWIGHVQDMAVVCD